MALFIRRFAFRKRQTSMEIVMATIREMTATAALFVSTTALTVGMKATSAFDGSLQECGFWMLVGVSASLMVYVLHHSMKEGPRCLSH
jgi:hypothetical protein